MSRLYREDKDNMKKIVSKMRFFSGMPYSKQRKIIIFAFLFIPTLLLLIFTYLPTINMFYYSFLKWNGYSPVKKFVGFDNYIKIFTRKEYFSVFKVSLYYFAGSFVQLGLALYFATLLSFKTRLSGFFKGSLFFPNLINGVAIGFIFLFFFVPNGTFDTLLTNIGLGGIIHKWLGDPAIVNYSLAATSIWRYMGFNFIVFLGAIQSIPTEIYEAAKVDGASKFQEFKYIILPSILPIVSLNILLSIKGSLAVYEIPFIMTGGGNGSKTFVIQTLNLAFEFNKFGLASAMAIILLIITLIILGFQKLIFGRGDE